MSIIYEITNPSFLTEEMKYSMFQLMDRCYENVEFSQFNSDLSKKNWVILLKKSLNLMVGFSTLKVFSHLFKGQNLRIAFSGDTIIDPHQWGSIQLPLAFGRLMNEILQKDPNIPLYWMLISKGFRTYRFLPVFFKEFFPKRNTPTPLYEEQLIQSLGVRLFPNQFQSTGIVKSVTGSQILREDYAGGKSKNHLKNSHIQFFFQTNPGHRKGDELVCLARFTNMNLNSYILRELKFVKSKRETPNRKEQLNEFYEKRMI